jgi:hypothetical protein
MYKYVKSNDFIDDYEEDFFDSPYDKDFIEEEIFEPKFTHYSESESEESQLRKFYNTHIKDKTDYGIDTYAIYTLGHELWNTLETKEKYGYLYDFMRSPEFVEVASKKFNVSPEKLIAVIDYSEAKDTYSDWYKDVYGFRPRG